MTISSTTNKVTYNGDGVTTILPYTFKILSQAEILVQKQLVSDGTITNLVLTTDYTVSGVGINAGGNITLVSPSQSGYKYVIKRAMQRLQPADFNEYDTFPAETLEMALDRLTMIAQEDSETIGRSLKIDSAVTGFSTDLPNPTLYTSQLIRVNAAGTAFDYLNPADIGAYSMPSGTGILVQIAPFTAVVRTATGTANEITVTNGDGVSGNPVFSLPNALTFTGKTVTGGTFSNVTLSGTIQGSFTFSGDLTLTTASMTSQFNEVKGADIASASTTNLATATGNYVDVTGTTTITALGTVQAGARRTVRFTGALTLTHNASSLILPTGGNITTTAGDVATFISLGSGNWRCTSYTNRDNTIILTDVTTNNVSTSAHGFMVKVPGTNTVWLGSGSGSYGQVPLTTHVSGILPKANGGTGSASSVTLIQRSSSIIGAISTTNSIPGDSTIPQSTEGDSVHSVNFTPLSTTSKVVVRMTGFCFNASVSTPILAFFIAAGNAVKAVPLTIAVASARTHWSMVYEFSPGSTALIAMNLRAGVNTGTLYVNQDNGFTLGGVNNVSYIEICEYDS